MQGVYPNWKSLNETVATIDESGLATTIANGKATIKAQWVNSNDMELTATADLWVTGDVFALDQANGNLVQIDIAKKKIRPEYIIGLTAGSTLGMVIENYTFAAVAVDNQPTGAIEYVSLDIENPYFIDSLELYDNHRGLQAICNSYNQIVYLAEPETSDLTLFQQNTNTPYFSDLVGVILLRDNAHPVSLIELKHQYLVVLTDNGADRSRLADSAALYFFDNNTNALQLMVPVSITNPKKIDRAFDDQNNEILVTLGGSDNSSGPTTLDFWDEIGGNLQSATLATAVNAMASGNHRAVWLGDADQPRLYVYGTEESDWIRGLGNPLILPSGSAVTTMEMNVSRREVWVANDEGTIFLYGLDSYALKDTYECDGCGIVDLAIW
ncbi:MAG: hypothetical protein GX444_07715 [Myxococcales bacterium]|nr:hypothetical protein [Myxococcales bacterium]